MTNRRLGPTDIWISPIGLGCWQFSGGQGFVGRYWPVLEPAGASVA
jgi:aryl-alcohol dehydrogenase-like predicted oxidoreductase